MADPKIRPAVLLKIRDTIEQTNFFSFHDFLLSEDEQYSTRLVITYAHKPSCALKVHMPSEKTETERSSYFGFSGEYSPGEVHVTERFSTRELSGLLATISKWLYLIEEDLKSDPMRRELAAQQSQIDELLETVTDLDDNYFSAKEAEVMRQRLDAMEQRFEERLRAESGLRKEDIDRRVAEMVAQIDALKEQVSALNKKAWWKAIISRVVKWSTDPKNQKLIESGASTIKQLVVGDGPGPGPAGG